MRVLIAEDDMVFRGELEELASSQPGVDSVVAAATASEFREALARSPEPALALLDLNLPADPGSASRGTTELLGGALAAELRACAPRCRIVVVSSLDPRDSAALMVRERVDDFVSKESPFEEIEARVAAQLRLARVAAGGSAAAGASALAGLVGASPAMVELRAAIVRCAPLATPVLVTGESGSGKELVASALHHASTRASGPLIPFHAAAVGEGLLEAELFGYKKGAFTGAAADRAGVVEAAEGGTLFLDEIGELPEAFQVKLLRFLDSGSFHRLGEDRPRQARVRLVFATHRDLPTAVEAGRFRRDLLYRLDVLRIHVPALRDRIGDLQALAEHWLARLSAQQGRRPPVLRAEALAQLAGHDWPGNVRELRNVLERALLEASGSRSLEVGTVVAALRGGGPPYPPGGAGGTARYRKGLKLKEFIETGERGFLVEALAAHQGHVARAAAALGIGRRTLYDKLLRYGIAAHRPVP